MFYYILQPKFADRSYGQSMQYLLNILHIFEIEFYLNEAPEQNLYLEWPKRTFSWVQEKGFKGFSFVLKYASWWLYILF